MDLRKAHLDTPWPPNDNEIGVIIIAHSMGYVITWSRGSLRNKK